MFERPPALVQLAAIDSANLGVSGAVIDDTPQDHPFSVLNFQVANIREGTSVRLASLARRSRA